ncbi:MAG: hypothetical protein H6554_11770 [Chitinophagales bacterium]|nr:hypothetical protein [Chitinophagales bacterium]
MQKVFFYWIEWVRATSSHQRGEGREAMNAIRSFINGNNTPAIKMIIKTNIDN